MTIEGKLYVPLTTTKVTPSSATRSPIDRSAGVHDDRPRHDRARRREGLQADARQARGHAARRQERPAHDNGRVSVRQPERDRSAGQGPARLDQLLPARGPRGVPYRVLRPAKQSRHVLERSRAEQPARVSRAAVLQDSRRHQARAVLPQRQVRADADSRSLPHPDRGEEKFLSKNYKAIDKQIEEAFKPKKKQ